MTTTQAGYIADVAGIIEEQEELEEHGGCKSMHCQPLCVSSVCRNEFRAAEFEAHPSRSHDLPPEPTLPSYSRALRFEREVPTIEIDPPTVDIDRDGTVGIDREGTLDLQ